jgi:alkanesulfonate monooxygenase SsuD/methylene tetrahydromethanopterin reductase-like flavin-dependent oxidoreductase (luciferase family)
MEEGEWPRYFIGTPATVRDQLEQMAGELGISELIVNTITWEQRARLRSYELLANVFGLAD